MSDGHCEHCRTACFGGGKDYGLRGWIRHINPDGTVEWNTGHCPACAEREWIVALLEAEADESEAAAVWSSPSETCIAVAEALAMEAELIRDGKHLEATDV